MPVDVGFEVHGEGEPVLLLAGWTQPRQSWHRFVPWLPEGLAAVLVDNRETGDTGPCPEGFTLADLAADALSVLDHLGVDSVTVVGHSMGGMIAQELALQAGDRLRALVLVSTHGGAGSSIPPDLQTVLPPSDLQLPADEDEARLLLRATVLERLLGPACPGDRAALAREEAARAGSASADLDGLVRQLQAMSGFEPGDAVAALGLPTVVVHGDHDPLVPYENGVRLAARLGAPLRTLAGIGHMVPWEAPEALVSAVADAMAASPRPSPQPSAPGRGRARR